MELSAYEQLIKDRKDFEETIGSIELKFSSGNHIDVERATITRNEWDIIVKILKQNNIYPKGHPYA